MKQGPDQRTKRGGLGPDLLNHGLVLLHFSRWIGLSEQLQEAEAVFKQTRGKNIMGVVPKSDPPWRTGASRSSMDTDAYTGNSFIYCNS